jgi:hypothetical protein
MSKKTFIGGFSSVLGEATKPKRGRPATQAKEVTKSSGEGTKPGEIRATFIVREELLDKLKAIAYWDRVLIKEVVDAALAEAVAKYEKKNGEIALIPKK